MRRAFAIVALIVGAGCGRESAAPAPAPKTATAVPESAWIASEVTTGKTPRRVIVMKTGMRTTSDVLIVDQPAEVKRAYDALAGNQRVGHECGFQWQYVFEYADGASEAIDISEECEQFRRNPEATWREVKRLFDEASDDPSHHAIYLLITESHKPALEKKLGSTFGTIVPTDFPARLLLISKEPWTENRIERLREACAGLARVDPIA
jgi:hypothetical protein